MMLLFENCFPSAASNVKPVLAIEPEKEPIGFRFYVTRKEASAGDPKVRWQGFVPSYNNTALIAEHGMSSGRIAAVDLTGESGKMVASNYRRLVHGWELPVSPRNMTDGSPGMGE
jgi:hypothetical protein